MICLKISNKRKNASKGIVIRLCTKTWSILYTIAKERRVNTEKRLAFAVNAYLKLSSVFFVPLTKAQKGIFGIIFENIKKFESCISHILFAGIWCVCIQHCNMKLSLQSWKTTTGKWTILWNLIAKRNWRLLDSTLVLTVLIRATFPLEGDSYLT